jgi:hypothetical protein
VLEAETAENTGAVDIAKAMGKAEVAVIAEVGVKRERLAGLRGGILLARFSWV